MKKITENNFSFINEFNKWIKEEKIDHNLNRKKNQRVYPKTSKKLTSKIVVEDGCYKELCKEFIKQGGKVIGGDGKMIKIEVHSGTFFINEKFIYF